MNILHHQEILIFFCVCIKCLKLLLEHGKKTGVVLILVDGILWLNGKTYGKKIGSFKFNCYDKQI